MSKFPRFVKVNATYAGFCSLCYLGFHTVCVPIWRQIHVVKEDLIRKPNREVRDLVTTVMNDMKLSNKEKNSVKLFMIRGPDLRHIGDLALVTGLTLGIPINYLLKEKVVIKPTEKFVQSDNETLSPASKEFSINSFLLLSEDAKKFAIAQEIYNARHPSFYWLCALPLLLSVCVNALYLLALKRNPSRFQNLSNFRQIRIVFVATSLYAIIFDVTGMYKDGWSDFQAAKLGKEYLLGGIEFYEKVVERNKIYKKLKKEAPFTEDGEYSDTLFRRHKMKLKKRITFLKDLKKAINLNQPEPSIWDYISYLET